MRNSTMHITGPSLHMRSFVTPLACTKLQFCSFNKRDDETPGREVFRGDEHLKGGRLGAFPSARGQKVAEGARYRWANADGLEPHSYTARRPAAPHKTGVVRTKFASEASHSVATYLWPALPLHFIL